MKGLFLKIKEVNIKECLKKRKGKIMKKNQKKVSVLLIAVLVAMTFLTGCGGKEGNNNSTDSSSKSENSTDSGSTSETKNEIDENTPAWQLDSEKDVELTWYVNAGWWEAGIRNDFVVNKIKEDTGITINFMSGDDTKLNTMFASGDKPDIITIMDANSTVANSAQSWAYALNDLADQYDPYFYKVTSEDTMNWFQLDDGKTYGYPNYSNSQKDYDEGLIPANSAFIIRKDVYEALGEPAMGTQEEFLDVLGRIKEQYPDLIPLGWNDIDDKLQNYLGVPIEDEKGNYYNRNLDEDYLSWIKTYNKAYLTGYISDDLFADDGTTFDEKLKTGKYACLFLDGPINKNGPLREFMDNNPDSYYIAIDGPKSTIGNEPTLSQAGLSGWMRHFITKDCSDPAKAIQLFTYLLSDYGQILNRFGVEGETFTSNEDGLYTINADILALDSETLKTEYRFGDYYLFGHDRYGKLDAKKHPEFDQITEWGTKYLKPQFLIEQIDPDNGTEEARSLSAITTNWDTTVVSMVRAGSDEEFNQILADYKQFLEDNDWDAIVAVRSEKMQNNREKLGLK